MQAIDRLDSLADSLLSYDLSKPRYNLSALNVYHTFESDSKPSFIVRNAEPYESRLVAPGTKGVADEETELDANEFENELPEINERLEMVANKYQEFANEKNILTRELKKYTINTKLKGKESKFEQVDRELAETKIQYEQIYNEIEAEKNLLDENSEQLNMLMERVEISEKSEADMASLIEDKKKEKWYPQLAQILEEVEHNKAILEEKEQLLENNQPKDIAEHLNELYGILTEKRNGSGASSSYSSHSKVTQVLERLQQLIDETDDLESIIQFLEQVLQLYINTIDAVAKGGVTFENNNANEERMSRRLSLATAVTPQQRTLCAQLLCLLYDHQQTNGNENEFLGMPEQALRKELTEFAEENGIQTEQVSQIIYSLYGKRLIEVDRTTQDHLVQSTWK
ncbi:hypothetical protein H4219_003914 [Mycoemilia scoparia]|uniref:Uncharacterized protein n=1 Tax=Mycoemilia scoparia TaxID=417184 RepID=A0A9W7ZZ40_9FUNG|nr:hypothetical protein H4219_003914 [Mycoemilia scoparia]